MKKRMTKAFGKEVYLIGSDKDGVLYWLEQPKFDCGWYWGCGYVETYTDNENPSVARDSDSHSHFDYLFFNSGTNAHDAFTGFFTETVLHDKETWALLELMSSVYTFREMADTLSRGGSHYTSNPCKAIIQNQTELTRINTVVLPALFDEVKKLLTEEEITL